MPEYCRLFRTTGVTLEQFLIRQRVELDKRTLLDPRFNVAEVAERCGFCNPAYFASVFKKYWKLCEVMRSVPLGNLPASPPLGTDGRGSALALDHDAKKPPVPRALNRRDYPKACGSVCPTRRRQIPSSQRGFRPNRCCPFVVVTACSTSPPK
jgi:hypothetical protein